MRNLLVILIIGSIGLSCDDGDIFEVSLEFDQKLSFCEDTNPTPSTFLLYETKSDPSESLSLIFPNTSTNSKLLYPTEYNSIDPRGYIDTITINNTNTRFNYRTYNGNPDNLICQFIPDPGTEIIQDYSAAAGAEAQFITSFEDDDNDGILTIHEGRGAQNEDGSYPFAQDTDDDGLPDYIDEDDDNDGILTKNETSDANGDGNPDDALNTDALDENPNDNDPEDVKPNYLDNDDDGDGVLSINEDADQNGSLLNDIDQTIDANNDIPRYLDKNAVQPYTPIELDPTEYTRTTTVFVTILDANIGILSTDVIILGTYTFTATLALPEEVD